MANCLLKCVCLALIFAAGAANTLQFAKYYNSHMVLQKEPQRAVLWGYASTIGDTVNVALNGSNVAHVRVTNNTEGSGGIWMTKIPAQKAGGPYTISISSKDGNTTLTDVMFGDVWVCSGQSNMAFTMLRIFNHTEELIEASHFHKIRIFKVRPTESSTERQDVVPLITWRQPKNDKMTPYFSAVCLLYAMELVPHINYPIGLIESDWGGTPVEAWSSPDARAACSNTHVQKRNPRSNHVLWNAMIRPLLPFTIYGAIWYQGESNSGRADDYACRFPAMIDDWRQKFHQKSMGETRIMFPFGFVQLSALGNTTMVGGFPALRWAQTANYGYVPNQRLRNVFMAVAMDLPDFNSPYGFIHPRDKIDVARRLALAGRAVAYNESNVDYQGPLPTSFVVSNGSVTIKFGHRNDGNHIEVRDTARGFDICCVTTPTAACLNYNWLPTPIVAMTTTSVTLKTTLCHGFRSHLGGVRYAWHSSPCEFKKCAIYGRESDLPAPPFTKTAPF